MKGGVSSRAIQAATAALLLLGCAPSPAKTAPPPKASAQEQAETPQPIPSDLREQIARASAIGRQLYVLDKVAAIGTDVLLANVPSIQQAGVAGYLPVQEGNDDSQPVQSFLVSFFTKDEPVRIAFEVRVAPDTAPGFQAFSPPKEASADFKALVRARHLALNAIPVSNQPINPVLLPAAANGETGVLVYLLAGTQKRDVAIFGRHFRVLVPIGGDRVTYSMPLSKTALELPTREPNGGRVEALIVTQLVTDFPVETHVFTSLLTKLPVYVQTSRGLWRVVGEQIAYLGEARADAVK